MRIWSGATTLAVELARRVARSSSSCSQRCCRVSLVALVDIEARLDLAALLGDLGVDAVDLVADIHAIGDGPLVVVFRDEVLVEEPRVCLEGVAVRPMRKASKYSSTCRQRL